MAVQSLPWEHVTLSSSPKNGLRPSRVEYAEGQPVGPYVLMSLIGRGGMGEVWSAHSVHSSERVALKLPRGDNLKDTRLLERFLREATLSHEVRHDNLLGAFAMGAFEGIPYFVMPEVDGPSLSKLLVRARARGRAMPRAAVLHIGLSLLDALSALHSNEGGVGTVHCDVSAGNVILSKTGGVYLADLGIAQPVGDRASGCGKRGSMSPEQIAGAEVTPRSDVFAVGVLLAQLLTDGPLYDGSSDVEVLVRNYAGGLPVSALPATQPLGAVLVRALSHAAGERYKSALAMASDLRAKSAHHGLLPSRLALAKFIARCCNTQELPKAGGQATPSTHHPVRRCATAGPAGRPGTGVRSALAPRIAGAAQRMVMGPVPPIDPTVAPFVAPLAQRAEYTPLPEGPFWTPYRPEVLVRCLVDIATERRSGILEVRSPQQWRRVCFVHGVIALVASSDSDEMIGSRLVDAGLVTEQEVERAVEHALRTGSQVGEALAALSGLPPLVVVRALIAQTTDRFLALADTCDGELAFMKGRNSTVIAPRPVEPTEALVQRLASRLNTQTRRLSRRRHPRRYSEAG